MTHLFFRPVLLAALLGLTLAVMPLPGHAIEEPEYQVVLSFKGSEDIELRQYAPYVVAEVVVEDGDGDAGNKAFPILAGYIFGKNRGEKKFDMTAPVTQSAAAVKMDMTAPVTQGPAAGGGQLIRFVLPKGVTLETAPEPLDPRVRLRLVPASRLAVIRYSGTWSQANYDEHLALLRAALAREGVTSEGEPVLARYNAPFTPWFLRRNEIWLPVR
jgi:SOUL heme-binding protein